MGLTTLQKFVLGLVALILLIIGWGMFPLFFKWLMIEIGTGKTNLEDFGPLGDIYGSLNTLFTSATLIFVVYATLLQRQANEDARDAMAKQLRQARNTTRKQIRQSQLATRRQLALAQATHDAKMKESKYSIFSNMFYALLNQKQSCFNNLKLEDKDGKTITADKLFYLISIEFFKLVKSEWKDIQFVSKEQTWHKLNEFIKKNNNNQSFTDFYSYLGYYSTLLRLINRADIEEDDRIFFRNILKASISASEKVALLWAAANMKELNNSLVGSGLMDLNFNEKSLPFAKQFFDKSCFSHPNSIENWDRFANKEETPA